MYKASLVSAVSLCLSAPAFAQDAPTEDQHAVQQPDIIITARRGQSQVDMLAGVSVLSGDELTRDLKTSIGDTLTRQPGVSATSFGPNASRPVLRGFQGERVRVLSDGIGSFDVSNTSVDHAVVINPLTADRIEVLRGPAALLYGSSAIGGVVNVLDSRIPRKVPDGHVHVDALATYGSAANERTLGGRIDVPVFGKLVLHVDGTYAKTDDLRTGGFILTPALRAEAAVSGDAEIEGLATLKGKLPNSAGRLWDVAGGLAWVDDQFSLGASVSRTENLYGVPVRFATTPPAPGEEGPEEVRLDMRQTRYDLRGEYRPESGFFEAFHLRAGHADYRHDELEDTGEIGTSFFAKGSEGRFEAVQRERDGWSGISGVQGFERTINIVGAEKFLPRSNTRQLGLFTVQSVDFGATRAEAGARVEATRQSADADAQLGTVAARRSFTAVSGSLGANHEFAHGWRLGLNTSYSERAPSAEELFSNGPHAGTQAFEIGDPAFGMERSKGLELTLHGRRPGFSLSGSLYHSWFNGFIYDAPTGAEQDGLPVFAYAQDKARYFGAELDVSADLAKSGSFTFGVDGVFDFTRATIQAVTGSRPAPRIPALRLLGGIFAKSDHVDVRAEVEHVDGQDRVAAFETTTPAYTLTNFSATVRPWGEEKAFSLIFTLNNAFDVVARRHASVLKDYAPLAGRDFRVTARMEF